MKEYKLSAWPDLPASFRRMAYRRMLHCMSERHASIHELREESGLRRTAVVQFLETLSERAVLQARERAASAPRLGWLKAAWRPPRRVVATAR